MRVGNKKITPSAFLFLLSFPLLLFTVALFIIGSTMDVVDVGMSGGSVGYSTIGSYKRVEARFKLGRASRGDVLYWRSTLGNADRIKLRNGNK